MQHLAGLGVFFGAFGIFMHSCGLFWWVSLYEKVNFPKKKKKR